MSSTEPFPSCEELEVALTASGDASDREESEAEVPTVSHIEDSANTSTSDTSDTSAESFVDLHLRAEIDHHLQSSPAALSVQAGTPPPLAAESEPTTTIDASQSPSTTDAPFVRGHRRRSTHVTPRDLAAFRRDVLGVDDRWYEEEGQSSTPAPPTDSNPEFEELNRAFESAAMSLNNSGNSGGPGPSVFSNYADNSQSPSSSASPTPRQLMSPVPQAAGQGNVVGMPGGMPMNAGHQMDLHHLYDMVVELSESLKTNRDITQNIVGSAEEIMVSSSCIHLHTLAYNRQLTDIRDALLPKALALTSSRSTVNSPVSNSTQSDT